MAVCRELTGTNEVPVRVVGSQFLVGTGLYNVDPLGDFELASALQVGSVGLDEFWYPVECSGTN